jgi:hypothetical protein
LKRRRQADDGVYHSISGPCQTFDDDKVPKRFFFVADAGMATNKLECLPLDIQPIAQTLGQDEASNILA